VYWPSGFEFPWPKSIKTLLYRNSQRNTAMRLAYTMASLRWIPNFGQMRFIYGGRDIEGALEPVEVTSAETP
jgi:hypothetical protein